MNFIRFEFRVYIYTYSTQRATPRHVLFTTSVERGFFRFEFSISRRYFIHVIPLERKSHRSPLKIKLSSNSVLPLRHRPLVYFHSYACSVVTCNSEVTQSYIKFWILYFPRKIVRRNVTFRKNV